MLSNFMIGLVFGVVAAAWVYNKLQRYNGGNRQSSLTGAIAVGVLGWLVFTTLLGLLF